MKKTTLFFALLFTAFSAVSGQVLDAQGNDFGQPSGNVLRLPDFPGGKKGYAETLGKAIVYSSEARLKQFTGDAVAEFIVEKDGSMTDIKLVKQLGYGLDEAVLKALAELPKWEPAVNLNGDPMRVRMQTPLTLTPPALTDSEKAKLKKTASKPSKN